MRILCVEDGSVDLDALEKEPLKDGAVLVYKKGTTSPSILELNNTNTKSKKPVKRKAILLSILIILVISSVMLTTFLVLNAKVRSEFYEVDIISITFDLTNYETTDQEPYVKIQFIDKDNHIKTLSKPYSKWTDTEKYALPIIASTGYIPRCGAVIKTNKLYNIFGYKYGEFEIYFD